MAINLTTIAEYVGRLTAPSTDYPFGSTKDDSTGTTGDGSPILKILMDDIIGLRQWLLVRAGITPDGSADSVTSSQYGAALLKMITGAAALYSDNGTANTYVLSDTLGDAPAAYDGMEIAFIPANTSTGASTVNVNGAGALPLQTRPGQPVTGGEIKAGQLHKAYYDASNARWVLSFGRPEGLGVGQSVQSAETTNTGATFLDGTPSYRAPGVTYTNTTGETIIVRVVLFSSSSFSGQQVRVSIDGGDNLVWGASTNSGGGQTAVAVVPVPAGSTYVVTGDVAIAGYDWVELRRNQ